MEIPHPAQLLGASATERLLAGLGELAVLSVVDPKGEEEISPEMRAHVSQLAADARARIDVARFATSASGPQGDDYWRQSFLGTVREIPAWRSWMWQADNCIESDVVEVEVLVGGPGMRRLDAVLDLLAAPFCAADVQASYASSAEAIAANKVTSLQRTSYTAASAIVGAVGGFHGFAAAGSLADRGSEFMLGRAGRVDQVSQDLARLVIAALAASEDPKAGDVVSIWRFLAEAAVEREHEISRIRTRAARGTPGDASTAARDARIFLGAEALVRSLLDDDKLSPPQVEGLSLLAAKHLYESSGWTTSDHDNSGQGRWRVNTENWVVVTAEVDEAARRVHFVVVKYGEQ